MRARPCNSCLTQYAVDHCADAALWMDHQGNFIYVNPAACRLLGWLQQQLMMMSLRDVAPEALAQFQTMQAETATLETNCWTHDGNLLPVEMTISRVELDGREFPCAFLRDLSDRRRMEEQLRLAHKMEAVGRLVDGVAHDFNNLLTAVMIYSGLLLNQLQQDSALRRHADQISLAAERGRALINQLLSFGRRQPFDLRLLALNRVIAGIQDMLQRLAGEDVVMVTDLAADLGTIEADRTQLEQVIINLAVNARDAMPEGGHLRIETANFTVGERFARRFPGMLAGPYVRLTVTDNGCGMDAETQSHVFEPFFTTKQTGPGIGLGLSTVYGIVRQSGARPRHHRAHPAAARPSRARAGRDRRPA